LVLNGNFYLADNFSASHQASTLLAAFRASVGIPPASGQRAQSVDGSARGLFGIKMRP
jgi:hypothetical protein